MWCASAFDADPSTSARIVAPRRSAADHSSRTSTAAPSLMMNPSRSASNGRDTPVDERAVMFPKPASAVSVIDASAPPLSTASQRPLVINRAALPMACVLAAHAVVVVSHGPR